MAPDEMRRRYQQAQQLLAAGRAADARDAILPLVQVAETDPGVRQLMARIRATLGDLPGAADELRAALRGLPGAGRATAEIGVQLGLALRNAGQADQAEAALRRAAQADPTLASPILELARLLIGVDRGAEALEVLAARVRANDPAALQVRVQALNALGRKAEALESAEQVVTLAPDSAVAWHNLACLQGDLRRYAAAERSTQRAVDLGLSVSELWLVRARALSGLDRLDEAQAALERALALNPYDTEANRELARLIWARTGDLQRTTERLAGLTAARPDQQALIVEHARIREHAGDPAGARALLAAAAARSDALPQLKAMAAQAAVATDPDRALRLAAEAFAGEPDNPDMAKCLIEAQLAAGDWRAAGPLADSLAARRPLDQSALALKGVVRRLAGREAALPWEDYSALVRGRMIDAPPGWLNLEAYLADLAAELTQLHVTRAHPIGQSVRGGTQTHQNLLESEAPAIKAFQAAIDGPIRAYLRDLGEGADPIRSRNTGRYRLTGMWSVRLAGEGFHTNHVHPEGWISSACHIVTPAAVDGPGREGWLKFGEPGPLTRPVLTAEHFEKPQPGRLVLFPSCMWHGTTPFSGPDVRLTVAFDLVPD